MANIVFYYPASNPFHPSAYDTAGVGGSEAALILASRALAQRGHAVTVFNHIPEAAEDHGVHYRPVAAFSPAEPCNVFILFRTFQAAILPRVQAAVKLFGSCDLYPSATWKANGKVSRAELVRHQREAQVMAYPCEWPENFCIAAMECLAAGEVPVTTDLAALPTTVGSEGVLLPGLPAVPAYQERFVVESHVGYDDPALVAAKLQRNLRLILLEDAEHPDDPFTLFNLGWAYLALNRTEEAVSVLQRSLKLAPPGASIVHKTYSLLATAHRQLQQPDAALAACRAGLARTPGDAELLFLEGLLLQDRGDFAGAERCYRQLLPDTEAVGRIDNPSYQSSAPPLGANVFDTPSFGSLELGLRGHHTRFRLAQVLFAQGKAAEAEALWRVIVADHPGDLSVWRHLAELFLEQQRWAELEEVLARLRAVPPLALEAAVLQAQGYLARREWASARRLLEEVVAQAPNAVWPWVYLSQALIQEGSAPDAIEHALRRVVELDAGQVQSWHNLAVHYRHHGRLPEALATCRQARVHHPHDGEMLLLEGIVSQEVGDLRAAETAWLTLLEQQGGSPAIPAEAPRQRRCLARHLLAGLYRRRRPDAAEAQWRALLVEQPEDPSAWSALGKLWLAQQRWGQVEQAAAHLARLPGGALEADVLQARVHLARREFEDARRLLEEAIARHPEAELPRVVLSYLHLQEGKDRAAAERALRDVLRVNPRNTEAEHNLAVLLRSGT